MKLDLFNSDMYSSVINIVPPKLMEFLEATECIIYFVT